MSDTAPPARYDSPWKAALTHAFRAFMRFFFAEVAQQIDLTKWPRFRDKELAGLSFGDKPDTMLADKLVEVAMLDGSKQWLLVHIEIQAQRDSALSRRMFDYNYRIDKEYALPVTSLVLLADNDSRWRPQCFHREAPGTATTFSFATAKLLDYADQTDKLMKSHNPFALVTLAHLRTQQAGRDPDALLAAKWQLTRLLYQHRWSKKRIIIFFKVINWMMALPKPHQDKYWRALRNLEKERKMEWISPQEQSFMDKGWEKGLKKGLKQGLEKGLETGRQDGLEQGRKEGARALLERLLTRRFGPLPKTVHGKLAKASLAQLEAWSDVLPEAESLKQVFAQ